MKKIVRWVLSIATASQVGCGALVVTEEVCDDAPIPVGALSTCGYEEIDLESCRWAQCDDANVIEMVCDREDGCVCYLNGERSCAGAGDPNNTCANGVPSLLCPGMDFAEFDDEASP